MNSLLDIPFEDVTFEYLMGDTHTSEDNNMVATSNKKNYGADGFTMEMVVDIMAVIDQATVKEACEFLIALGYGDTFYDGSQGFTIEEYAVAAEEAQMEHFLAEAMDNITFQGGPQGTEWYTLNLQCLLADHVAQSICIYGGVMVGRTLGVYA